MTMRSVLTLFFLLTTLAGAADPSPEVARLAAEVRGKGWIVFPARSEQGDWDLFLMRPDGSQRRALTRTPECNEAAPQFSRDGRRLLYRRLKREEAISGNRYGEQGVLIAANGDGTDARALGAEGELPRYLFSGVRPSPGAAALRAGEIWQWSCVFALETLLLPRTAALRLNRYPLRAGRGGRTCPGSLFGDPDTVPSKVPLSVRKYLFSRSAAVFGSSDVSAPKTQERYQVSPARKLAAPEDGRTPLNRYVRARERGRVRLDCMDTAKR